MVYNFRIAEITRLSPSELAYEKDSAVLPLAFAQVRKKDYSDVLQRFAGLLGTYIYNVDAYYLRIDGAFSHIKETTAGVPTFCGTETDDILFTFGKTIKPTDRTNLCFSGLLGIPTHKLYTIQHVNFGYSQVGTGLQIDGAYHINDEDRFLYGARYIRFFKRTAYDSDCLAHCFNVGNIGDILMAYKKKWHPHALEAGFTQRVRFGAKVFSFVAELIPKTNYVRSNLYLAYFYHFTTAHTPQRIMFNVAYGVDEYSRRYGNKYILSSWLCWTVHF